MEEMPKILKDFEQYKIVIQNRSRLTVEGYLTDLVLFFKYLIASKTMNSPDTETIANTSMNTVDEKFIQNISSFDIMSFLMYTRKERGNQAKANARKLSSIRSFFSYTTRHLKLTAENPALNIDSPSIKPSLPKYLSLEESVSLLDAAVNDTENPYQKRDYAILTLFLNCGMRLSELVGINLSDIDHELKSLRVLGKGSKERVVYLNGACQQVLREYLPERAKDGEIKPQHKNALFISRLHTRISNKTVQHIVYKYLKKAGLEYKHYSTHKLRHTAATLMYQQGNVDVLVLKDMLGHEQLNTTQIYTHISNTALEKAMEKNPLSAYKPSRKETISTTDLEQEEK